MLSEISQTQKDKHHMISLICGIQKTEQNRNKLTDTENKWVVPRGEWGRRMDKIGEQD